MICLTVGFGGSGGASGPATADELDWPVFLGFTSLVEFVKIMKSSSAGAFFVDEPAAGALLFSLPFLGIFPYR